MAFAGARIDQEQAHYERAIELFEGAGKTHPAARVSARLGEVEWRLGHLEEALERMERGLSVLATDEPDADIAALTTQLGRLLFFNGNLERSTELLEQGLALAEALRLPEVLPQALNTYGVISLWRGRPETALRDGPKKPSRCSLKRARPSSGWQRRRDSSEPHRRVPSGPRVRP
jgi:tetratricopeptide (TPR) repeat protein